MANTGITYGAWAFAQESASDWDADALADNATDTSAAISLSGKAACIVGVTAAEDNTGAIDGVCTVYVLGDADVGYEETTTGNPWSFTFTPVQNDTVYIPFAVDPTHYDNFKVAVLNESGQELAISVKYKTADVPVAS